MEMPKITLRLIGRVFLIVFLIVPTYPDAITGWDTVSSWSPGCSLFVMEPLGIIMMVGDAASFAREVEANPEAFRGDGLEVYQRDVAWSVVKHGFIFAGSALMLACAIWQWKRRLWRFSAAALMLVAIGFFISRFMVESQTYVGGAYHIGIGSYFWVATCLIFIATSLRQPTANKHG
jgi:hypothetical protein